MIWVIGLLLLVGGTGTSRAQDAADGVVRSTGATVNFFATIDPSEPIDGVRLEVPKGWTVVDVALLRYGSEPVALRRDTSRGGAVRVHTRSSIDGPHELVMRVRLPQQPGTVRWTAVTLVRERSGDSGTTRASFRPGRRYTQVVTVETPRVPDGTNQALALDTASAPVLLRPEMLPPLGPAHSFTIEFWMRTNGLDEVVLSSWNGDESVAYPAEFVVDRGGRLRFYSGKPGQHRALRSGRPIANGTWHHVAAVYDARRSRVQLFIDGRVVDSLQGTVPDPHGLGTLAVGGRIQSGPVGRAASADTADSSKRFSGWIDELRVWGEPRTGQVLRRMKSRPFQGANPGERSVARLGFDGDSSLVLHRWPDGARRVPSTLSFREGLRNLRAQSEGQTVTLHWGASSSRVESFMVERSTDGETFTSVATLSPDDARPHSQSETSEYTYTDDNVPGTVIYYRIRQRRADGREHTSGTIKIGLGSSEERRPDVNLIGNFPNPFTETTTVAYEVNEALPVSLTVWDLAGHRIAKLTDGTKAPGYHETTFEAKELPSGTYFVRLQANEHTQSHRMVILK